MPHREVGIYFPELPRHLWGVVHYTVVVVHAQPKAVALETVARRAVQTHALGEEVVRQELPVEATALAAPA